MRNLPKINNLVIKIGSNILADTDSGINEERIQSIADAIADIKGSVRNISVVSSGAIAAGFKLLGFKERPKEISDKQACAAVGQARLMRYYEKAFRKYNTNVAQILITKYDFSNRKRYLNAKSTIQRLQQLDVVPIINENDTVVVNELKYVESFGDNDNLSALVSGLTDADMLLILSDVDGLYTADPSSDPKAELIKEVSEINADILALAGGSNSGVGTGGMYSKITAAEKAVQAGCCVVIANGRKTENIKKIVEGEEIGSFFRASEKAVAKKYWLTHATIPKGVLIIDDGACRALTEKHSSLLAAGVIAVEGVFSSGDVVKVTSSSGDVAIGQVRYASHELEKIKQKDSAQIREILGEKSSAIVIHCDEMGII